MATWPLQTPIDRAPMRTSRRIADWVEARLDADRQRIAPWLLTLGAGIAGWFALARKVDLIGLLFLVGGGALAGWLIRWQRRFECVVAAGCAATAAGLLLISARAGWFAASVLA